MNNKHKSIYSIKTKFTIILALLAIVFLLVSIFALMFNFDNVMEHVSNFTYRVILSDFSYGAIDVDMATSDVYFTDESFLDFDFLEDEKLVKSLAKRNYAVNCYEYDDKTNNYEIIYSSKNVGVDNGIPEQVEQALLEEGYIDVVLGDYDYNCIYLAGTDSNGNNRAISFIFNISRIMTILYEASNFVIGLVVVCGALAMIASRGFVNAIANNILKINDYLKGISKTSLPLDRLKIHSKDELGQMSNTVNAMVDELKEKQTMDAELKLAARIQMCLLPTGESGDKRLDVATYIKPARNIGGDFYDYVKYDKDHFGFLIADVSGKGTPASMLMSMEINEMRNSIRTCNSLAEAVARANDDLCEENVASHFVTMWVGVIELSTGKVTFVNAGHNKPLLKKNGSNFEYIDYRRNPAIGFINGVEYKENEFTLEDGDVLYLYTDGIVEATNEKTKLYGEERLQSYLNKHKDSSIQELIDGTIENVNEFVGDAPQFDDMTLLAIKYNKNA